MVTNWLVDDCETDTNGRFVQHIRAHQRHGFRMLERLRVELSRRRDEGASFTDAWTPSVAKALRLLDSRGEHRKQWRIALNATQNEWRAAYEGEEVGEVVERVTHLEELVA
jgi:hypothetical protein